MSQVTLEQAIQIGVGHHLAGRMAEAERIYRQILSADPRQAYVHNLLGALAAQTGRATLGLELLGQAIAIQPGVAEYHVNLGVVLRNAGRYEEAVAAHRRALELKPGQASAWYNMGVALFDLKQLDASAAAYANAIRGNPNHAESHNNLATVFKEQKKFDVAIAAYREAIRIRPGFIEAHSNLGNAFKEQGRLDEAVAAYQTALKLNPNRAEVHYNLGIVLAEQGKLEWAVGAFKRAIELQPASADAYHNLGRTLNQQGKLDEATRASRRALEINQLMPEAYHNLAITLKDQGSIGEALSCFDRVIAMAPDRADFSSNRLYLLHFHPDFDAAGIYREHRRWNERHAEPLKKLILPYPNNRVPDRRLRIGYVSPDFGAHPVGRLLLPLLEEHDRAAFEVVCYSDVLTPDPLTRRFREQAVAWRDIAGLADPAVCEMVRRDEIDILVDLTMHMARNRLLVFAAKPAPVQVSYLAYCSTTGLDTIDYRLSDLHLDPPELGDAHYSEKTMRLPRTYWCYVPRIATPEVGPLPSATRGYVTFGCLNNFAKVSPAALSAWRRILQSVPASRIIIHAKEGSHCQRVIDHFAEADIDAGRVAFVGYLSGPDYFQLYGQIDIALDPFPCAGGTTTCDALWMGVPVVSLAGRTAVGRSGVSILSNVGLPELIARSEEHYAAIAAKLAADPPGLSDIRAGLRERMRNSPLMDAPLFARDVEAALRTMWRRWCGE